jgi:deoxyguanosine kinase
VYIVVEGAIGVGKTSLSRILAAHYSARLTLEVVEENPFLASFYQEPQRFGFQVQVFFLLSRFRQLEQMSQGELFHQDQVADYMFDKDFIFASMNLRDHEFSLYRELYSQLKPRLTPPDLVIYLRAETDLLLERITQRGRDFEQHMRKDYLQELSNHYDEYFSSYSGNVLTLNAHQFDFVGNLADQARVIALVEHALKNKLESHSRVAT